MLLVQSCKREELPDNSTDNAVFGIEGLINGQERKFTAGENDYYMHSSYDRDANNLLHFKGALKPIGCTDCRDFFEVAISNYTTSTSYDIDQAITTKNYPFLGTDTADIAYEVSFVNLSQQQAGTSFQWNIDGATYTNTTPVHLFSKKGIYDVTLQTTNGSCASDIFNKVYVLVDEPFCHTNIEVTKASNDSLIFVARTNGRQDYTFNYYWDFGDGEKRKTLLLEQHKDYSPNENFKVMLVTEEINNTCIDTTFINVSSYAVPPCQANFANEKAKEVHTDVLSKVTVKYTDMQGNVYSSAENAQSGSSFEILSVKDYSDNEKGEKTKLIECRFTGRLFNPHLNVFMEVENIKATIAVAYPK